MLARVLAMMVLAAFVVGVAGCNTVEGVGRDVKAGGAKVEQEAAEHRRY